MSVFATVAVLLLAALHVHILVPQMFLWTGPRARAAFGAASEFAEATKALAGNQGLYNGFLAAGVVWGAVASLRSGGLTGGVFFLVCFVETASALIALALVLAAH